MEYELVMLKGLKTTIKSYEDAKRKLITLAVSTFYKNGWESSSMQKTLEKIEKVSKERDLYQEWIQYVKESFRNISKESRVILGNLYLNNITREGLANKLNVKTNELAKKIRDARREFREELELEGCDSEYFMNNFGNLKWVKYELNKINTDKGTKKGGVM